ncbi:hypothetical protein CDL15_Pgr022463 [Punica granatum]|uniref:superoxide dismutase n=1 Tax=Punica granatum TaxID=22663 RepID=A0A218XSW3_PUNGR|nr:hypothetical protein CDL15_Pgr022463 [Punica granatum]
MALRTLLSCRTLAAAVKPELGFSVGLRSLVTFSLPDLPYDYGALEPAISGEIMQLHHQKHHQAYITNYNKALEQLELAMSKGDAPSVVKLQSAIKFNGGGSDSHLLRPTFIVAIFILLLCLETYLKEPNEVLSVYLCRRYPYDEAAAVAISTVEEFSDGLKEVHFVLFSDEIYDAWSSKAKELLQK